MNSINSKIVSLDLKSQPFTPKNISEKYELDSILD